MIDIDGFGDRPSKRRSAPCRGWVGSCCIEDGFSLVMKNVVCPLLSTLPTQVVKADASGVFSFACPRQVGWGAALHETEDTLWLIRAARRSP